MEGGREGHGTRKFYYGPISIRPRNFFGDVCCPPSFLSPSSSSTSCSLGWRRGPSGNFFFSVCPSVLRSLVDPEMPTDGVDLQMRSAEVKFTSRCLMPPSLPFYFGRVDEGPACFLIASVEFPCSVIVRVWEYPSKTPNPDVHMVGVIILIS